MKLLHLILAIASLLSADIAWGGGIRIPAGQTVIIEGPVDDAIGDLSLKLEELSTHSSNIYLLLDSPGGDVLSGIRLIRMMDILRQRGVRLTCIATHLVASMAMHIYAHCDIRLALPNTFLLFHEMRAYSRAGLSEGEAKHLGYELQILEIQLESYLRAELQMSRLQFEYHNRGATLFTAEELQQLTGFLNIISDVELEGGELRLSDLRKCEGVYAKPLRRQPMFGVPRGETTLGGKNIEYRN